MTELVSQSSSVSDLTPSQKRQLLKRLLEEKAKATNSFPMSSQQQGLWHAYRRNPEANTYNVFLPTRIRSPLSLDALIASIHVLSERHHSLRTTFTDADDKLRQTVHPSLAADVCVEAAEGCSEAELHGRVLSQVQRPFDLQQGPLLRLGVFRVGDDDHVVVATTHHIVTDFWSLVLIMHELREIYPAVLAGRRPILAEPTNNYSQYVQQQQALTNSNRFKLLKEYWQQQVADIDPVLELPLDYRRPKQFTSKANSIPIRFGHDASAKIRAFARRYALTTNAALLAAVQVLLGRYSRQTKFLVGIPASGRSEQKFEKTVGYFSGVLPIRADLTADASFAAFARQTSARMISGLDHEQYPFAEIVKDANPKRDTSRGPLIQALCTFENSHLASETGHAAFLMPGTSQLKEVGGMMQEPFPIPHPTCHYDIEFAFDTSSETIGGMVCYCVDLFQIQSMQMLVDNFSQLTCQLIEDSEAPISAVPWQQKATFDSAAADDTDLQIPPKRVLTPSLKLPPELQHASDQLAAKLIELGVQPNQAVAVVMSPTQDFLIAMMAVLQSGGAVVPIDANQPSLPLDQLLCETTAQVVITDRASVMKAKLGDQVERCTLIDINEFRTAAPPALKSEHAKNVKANASQFGSEKRENDPQDLAYIIFTSGSTGRPKGVMIEHQSICNTLCWREKAVPLCEDDRVIVLLSHQFDAGFGLILTTLSQGATLVWPQSSTPSAPDLDDIIDTLIRERVTVLTANPSLLSTIIHHSRFGECKSLRQVWTGGETMPTDLPQQLREHCSDNPDKIRLWNFYGPTETSVEATAYETPLDHPLNMTVPIGKPIANTNVVILDEHLQPVPSGVPGQIAIGGVGLSRGYLNQPTETAKRFRQLDSLAGQRVYLSGDLGRVNGEGLLEFLGRIDDQIKLRGYRIELEEIEQHLRTHPAIDDVAVCVIGHAERAILTALIVSDEWVDVDVLAAGLPRYKRPTRFFSVEAIPKNASGKIDRRALQQIASELNEAVSSSDIGITEARNPFEAFVAERWSEALGVSTIRYDESFFDAGGSSLQAAMLTSRLSEELGIRVPTSLLFDLADIRNLTRRLAELYPSQMVARFGVDSVRGESLDGSRSAHPLIAPWQPRGTQPPIFMVHPPGGIVVCYRDLAQRLAPDQPLYAIRSRGLHGQEALPATMEAMATEYVDAIQQTCPSGPVIVGGWSLGGLAAIEVTRQLMEAKREVLRLILLDTTVPEKGSDRTGGGNERSVGLEYGIDLSLDELGELPPEKQLPFLWEHAKKLGVLNDDVPAEVVHQTLLDLQQLFHHHVELANRYRLSLIEVPVVLFRPMDVPIATSGPRDRGWSRLASEVKVIDVPGQHHSMLSEPHVIELATHLRD